MGGGVRERERESGDKHWESKGGGGEEREKESVCVSFEYIPHNQRF